MIRAYCPGLSQVGLLCTLPLAHSFLKTHLLFVPFVEFGAKFEKDVSHLFDFVLQW